jgi:hypothetical protein
VERQKGDPTLVSQIERANRNLFVAFSIPDKQRQIQPTEEEWEKIIYLEMGVHAASLRTERSA